MSSSGCKRIFIRERLAGIINSYFVVGCSATVFVVVVTVSRVTTRISEIAESALKKLLNVQKNLSVFINIFLSIQNDGTQRVEDFVSV